MASSDKSADTIVLSSNVRKSGKEHSEPSTVARSLTDEDDKGGPISPSKDNSGKNKGWKSRKDNNADVNNPWTGMSVEDTLAVPMNDNDFDRAPEQRPGVDEYESILEQLPSEQEQEAADSFCKCHDNDLAYEVKESAQETRLQKELDMGKR